MAATAARADAAQHRGPHPVLTRPALLSHIFKFVARTFKDVTLLHVHSAWEDTAISYCPWMWERLLTAQAMGATATPPDIASLVQLSNEVFNKFVCRIWAFKAYSPSLLSRLQHVPAAVLDLSGCRKLCDADLRHLSGMHPHTLNLSYCYQLTPAAAEHITSLTTLKALNLSACSKLATDASMAAIVGACQHISILNLAGCADVNDNALMVISVLPLQVLSLSGCNKISDAGLRHLAAVESLSLMRNLDLRGLSLITDAGVAVVCGALHQLQSLTLGGCVKITDAGLQHLITLQLLRTLDLWGVVRITDAGLQHVAGLKQLKSLNLTGCVKISDVGVAHLGGLVALEKLSLANCVSLTDGAMSSIGKTLASLKTLDASGCKSLTGMGLSQLNALPALQTVAMRLSKISDSAKRQFTGGREGRQLFV
jgi:hypothetical protein